MAEPPQRRQHPAGKEPAGNEPREQPPGKQPPEQRPLPDRSRLTSRAAVLAVVICAVALSLAYPVREYIAQRRQIDQLQAEQVQTLAQLRELAAEQRRLNDPAYIERQARDRLHLCLPGQTCYVVIGDRPARSARAAAAAGAPWYDQLWHSVRQADQEKSR